MFLKKTCEFISSKAHFCSQKCCHEYRIADKANRFKNGSLSQSGYKVIYVEKERIFEHRHLVEIHIGRKLKKDEVIHHINENKLDNRIENLLITDNSNHRKFHVSKKWSRSHDKCINCERIDRKHEAKGLCSYCYNFQRNSHAPQIRKVSKGNQLKHQD